MQRFAGLRIAGSRRLRPRNRCARAYCERAARVSPQLVQQAIKALRLWLPRPQQHYAVTVIEKNHRWRAFVPLLHNPAEPSFQCQPELLV
jgi:hypothetical protein